jgi:hypothetical protein
MTKIRIAVTSALFASLVAGSALLGASAAHPAHAEAGPVTCCRAVDMSTK